MGAAAARAEEVYSARAAYMAAVNETAAAHAAAITASTDAATDEQRVAVVIETTAALAAAITAATDRRRASFVRKPAGATDAAAADGKPKTEETDSEETSSARGYSAFFGSILAVAV